MGIKAIVIGLFIVLWMLWPSLRTLRVKVFRGRLGLISSTLWILLGILLLIQIITSLLTRSR